MDGQLVGSYMSGWVGEWTGGRDGWTGGGLRRGWVTRMDGGWVNGRKAGREGEKEGRCVGTICHTLGCTTNMIWFRKNTYNFEHLIFIHNENSK